MGGVWSKSPISQKIVPRNRISKSLEGKQFINVCWWLNITSATIAWCKLMQLGISLALVCHFLAERFHTLKIELDFFSRHGHWTLCWTGVYQSLLLKIKQRRSSFLFFSENGNFAIFCCKFVLKYISFIFTSKRNVNCFKEMLWLCKIPKRKTKKRNKIIAKEQLLLVHSNKVCSFF